MHGAWNSRLRWFGGCAAGEACDGGVTNMSPAAANSSVAKLARPAAWLVGVCAVFVAGAAQPQGNIDAGKTPAQMFSETCSACHKRPQELRRGASAGFLRQHYMTGAQEASAMASYLASVASDPRNLDQRKERLRTQQEKAKALQEERAKARQQAQARIEAAKRVRRDAAPKAAAAVEAPAPDNANQRAEAPPPTKLEPFEE